MLLRGADGMSYYKYIKYLYCKKNILFIVTNESGPTSKVPEKHGMIKADFTDVDSKRRWGVVNTHIKRQFADSECLKKKGWVISHTRQFAGSKYTLTKRQFTASEYVKKKGWVTPHPDSSPVASARSQNDSSLHPTVSRASASYWTTT